MSEQEWEEWEEWLAHPRTQKLLDHLKRRARFLKSRWAENLWGQTVPDPTSDSLPDYRARSQVYDELSGLNREILEELLGHEGEAG